MEPLSAAAAVSAILSLVDWKEVARKLSGDTALEAAKLGRKSLIARFRPDERELAAKQAVALFSEEFLKELDDKSPLTSAIPGYHAQLRRLIELAAPDIASWFQPEISTVDLAPVERMWSGLELDPLPDGFDWPLVAQNYGRAIRARIKKDPELRQQFAVALQEDTHSFDQRFAPGFDLAGYRDFLQKKCALLQLSAMHASAYDRRIGLWNIFVPQSARETAPVRDIPREILRQLRREGHVAGDRDESDIAELREAYQSSPAAPVLDILARRRPVVLLGDPGSGKTSLLKYLVLRWVTKDGGPFPLWVELKEYAHQPTDLKRYLESGVASFGLDARRVDERLHAGQAALYLDGLDEIFDARIRSSVVEQIAVFSARYPQTPVVVTSRIIGYEPERLRNAGFAHATLEDFDDGQVLEFLEKWHAVAEEDPAERTRLQSRLARAVRDAPAIRELAGNPLLLTMMAILNRNQELPRDRVELYREASRVLLHEWDASRALLPTDTFARQEKEALLRELAGAMQQTEGGLAGNLIERDRLSAVFRKSLANLGIPDSYQKAESLVRQLTERSFILCFAGADRFSFVHRTFLEYFCAAWFVEQFEKQRTLTLDQLKREVFGRHWHDETWHEVLRLIAGMVGEKPAGELIEFLISIDGRYHQLANLMLAAGCLSEVRNRGAIRSTDHRLRQRFVEDAIRYDLPYYYEPWQEEEAVQPTRSKAVALVASVWRSRETREWLFSMAKLAPDWMVRSTANEELARGWKDDPDTLPLLKDRARWDENFVVQSGAVRALARGWKDHPDTLRWLKDCARDERSTVRSTAVQELARGWKDDPETFPWLQRLALSEENRPGRSTAIEELARGWKDHPATLPLLKRCARSGDYLNVRMAAVHELARGWKDDPDTLPLVREHALFEANYAVRLEALEDLVRGWKDHPGTLPLLKDRSRSDSFFEVQILAVQELALGWKEDPDILAWLKDRARSDKDSSVRRAAVQAVAYGWKDDPDTLPWLQDCIGSAEDHFVRSAAVEQVAWRWKDDPGILPWLKDLARSDTENEVGSTAVQELARGWNEDPDTLPWLLDAARSDENFAVRGSALRELAIGWHDDPATLPLLKDRARFDESDDVRLAALRELARGWRDDPDTLPLLKDLARSATDAEVRKEALGELARGWKDDPEVGLLLDTPAASQG